MNKPQKRNDTPMSSTASNHFSSFRHQTFRIQKLSFENAFIILWRKEETFWYFSGNDINIMHTAPHNLLIATRSNLCDTL